MPSPRNIDYDLQINGGLCLNSSVFIDDVATAIMGKLDSSPSGGSAVFTGNLSVNGILSATSISGIDFSNYYTKSELSSVTGGVSVHWGNLSNVPSALGEWSFKVDDKSADKINGGETLTLISGTNISLENPANNQLKISAKDYSAGEGLGLLNGVSFYNSDRGSDQKIFKKITNGTQTISSTMNEDTLTLVGSGATTVSYDVANKKITISSVNTDTNTTYSVKSGEKNLVLSGAVFNFSLTPSFTNLTSTSGLIKTSNNFAGINIDTLYSTVNTNTSNITTNTNSIGSLQASVSSHISGSNPHNISLEAARSKGSQINGAVSIKTDTSLPLSIEHNSSSATTNTRFAVKDKTGTPTFTIDSEGNIVAKSITVETLNASTSTESDGDFKVNGNLTVDGSANIGNDPAVDVININSEFNVFSIGSPNPVLALSTNKTTGVTTGVFSGPVNGVDVNALKQSYDSHHHDDKYYTEVEIDNMMVSRGTIKASTQTILSGSTAKTWTHNYGSTNYYVSITPYGFDRHYKIKSKGSNQLTIGIDDECSADISFDIILVGW